MLAACAAFPGESLAALYDPTTMPPALACAQAALDRAVDRCYPPPAFPFGAGPPRIPLRPLPAAQRPRARRGSQSQD
nr:type IIL restriction-modification enzyme MmeI [Hymenobacter roseosalivarius]